MAPVVHGLEAQYSGKVGFVYLDIDDSRNTALKQQFGFQYQPHFILVDGVGVPVKTWLGNVPAEEFEVEFAKLIN